MTQYGTWVPYAGADAALLAVTLLTIGIILAYFGRRMKRPVGVDKPGRTVKLSENTQFRMEPTKSRSAVSTAIADA